MPFKSMKRASGVLAPLFSLPSSHGIGTMGASAYSFVDFLKKAGQTYWQLLPLGPTGFGDSPYQALSSFAGNPYFIDLDLLVKDGLITRTEMEAEEWGREAGRIDYGKIFTARLPLLKKAYARGGYTRECACFAEENQHWLRTYALFMAAKEHFGMRAWPDWEDATIRLHEKRAVEKYEALLKDEIAFVQFVQYLFFRQWNMLREYVHAAGIKLIGDLPIYVALDSADAWAHPELFLLDENHRPFEVAGVPPDYFSKNGQLWGNPLYRWDRMQEDGYRWWMERIMGTAVLFDGIRFDHFRGLSSYWCVPAGEKTARKGEWRRGPGLDFIRAVQAHFPELILIAEDLGLLDEDILLLLEQSGYPGMRVMEFAFDFDVNNRHLPHNYIENCVCYIGTHDNGTLREWPEKKTAAARAYFNMEDEAFHWGLIRGGMASEANLFIARMQDYLDSPASARINTPGTAKDNWRWRLYEGDASEALAQKIQKMTAQYGRASLCAGERKISD